MTKDVLSIILNSGEAIKFTHEPSHDEMMIQVLDKEGRACDSVFLEKDEQLRLIKFLINHFSHAR